MSRLVIPALTTSHACRPSRKSVRKIACEMNTGKREVKPSQPDLNSCTSLFLSGGGRAGARKTNPAPRPAQTAVFTCVHITSFVRSRVLSLTHMHMHMYAYSQWQRARAHRLHEHACAHKIPPACVHASGDRRCAVHVHSRERLCPRRAIDCICICACAMFAWTLFSFSSWNGGTQAS